MSGAVVVALLAPGAVAFLLLDATLRDGDGARPPLALRAALAAGFGLGVSSCVFYVALQVCDGSLGGVALFDAILVVAAAALWVVRRPVGAGARAVRRAWSRLDRALAAAVGAAFVGWAGSFVVNALLSPHGEMDAWMMWNLKSRFLFYDAADWRTPLAEYLGHPEYPYFLPTAVAHGWRYLGRPDQTFAIAVAGLFALATLALLCATVGALRGRTAALLAGLCLLATPGFALRASWLYGDVPLGFFLLATLALLAYGRVRGAARPGTLAWAGLAAGLAVWTKNEGALFLAALSAVGLVVAVRAGPDLRAAGWFAAGAAGPLALTAHYKLAINAQVFLAGRPSATLIALLLDPARYATILAFVGRLLRDSPSVWLALALPLFVLVMGPSPDPRIRFVARWTAAAVALIAAGFFFVYVITPFPLEWHVSTSCDRLLFDLWPSALLAIFLWTASPTERASTEAAH